MLIKNLLNHLNTRDRILVHIAVIARIFLVSLDLAGIFLIGVVVSLMNGTIISQSSPLTQFLNWIHSLGLRNSYAVILGMAIGFFILKGLISYIMNVQTARFVARIEATKSVEIFAGSASGNLDKIEGYATQEMVNGLTYSTTAAFGQAIVLIGNITSEVALLVGVSIYLAITNFGLFLVVAMFFGSVGVLMQLTVGRLSGRFGRRQHWAQLQSESVVIGYLANYRQIVSSGNAPFFLDQFAEKRKEVAKYNALYATISSLPRYITELSVMLGVALLVLMRINPDGNSITAPTIAVFLTGIFRIVASMLPLQNAFSSVKRIEHEANLSFKLLAEFREESMTSLQSQRRERTHIAPSISVSEVSFAYPSSRRSALSNVSFSVKPGSYVAITGRSGAGKSTLVDLMLGLRKPNKGVIRIDGFSPEVYRAMYPGSVSYVPQVTKILEGSLLENITLKPGSDDFSPERLQMCLKVSNLEEFVEGLENGVRTILGSEGIGLSGGQAQRIGLARALYSNPDLLVLDEATSALDAQTELNISQALSALKGKVTCIVIAHRAQTLAAADYALEIVDRGIVVRDVS
jgi:ABC-type multidrug transport system fused ATPase/permease subunit